MCLYTLGNFVFTSLYAYTKRVQISERIKKGKNGGHSGYFSRGVYFADYTQRAQFANFEISKLNLVGVVN